MQDLICLSQSTLKFEVLNISVDIFYIGENMKQKTMTGNQMKNRQKCTSWFS